MLRPSDKIPGAPEKVVAAQKKREQLVERMTVLRSELSRLKKELRAGMVTDLQAHQSSRVPLLSELAGLEREVSSLSDFIMAGGVAVSSGKIGALANAPASMKRILAKRDFVEPASISEATQRRDHLNEEIRQIELQLSARSVMAADGRSRFSPEDGQWKGKALWAKRKMEAEAHALKRWIRDRQMLIEGPVYIEGLDTDDPAQLLLALYKLSSKRLQWGSLEADEQKVWRAVRDFINR